MTEAFYVREHGLTSLSLDYNSLYLSSLVGAQDSMIGGIQIQRGTWSYVKKETSHTVVFHFCWPHRSRSRSCVFAEPLKMLLVPVSSCLCMCIPATCLKTWGRVSFMYPVLKMVFRYLLCVGDSLRDRWF